jgi:hypothetical protein
MTMQMHSLHVVDGRERVLEIRTELFVFGEVLDVFVTGRSDVVVVACSGHPRPAEWLSALRTAGYEIPLRRRGRAPRIIATTECSRLAA